MLPLLVTWAREKAQTAHFCREQAGYIFSYYTLLSHMGARAVSQVSITKWGLLKSYCYIGSHIALDGGLCVRSLNNIYVNFSAVWGWINIIT
jgi:hypothetical protein